VERIALQERAPGTGVTDIELISENGHLIIEAKRGWVLPTPNQLGKYAERLVASPEEHKHLLALTECSAEYANEHLPTSIHGIPVGHWSWEELVRLAEGLSPPTHAEKRLLREVVRYLKGVVTMQDLDSLWVYCVSLGSSFPEGTLIPKEVLQEQGIYYHPSGGKGGWPKIPPNLIAFRWSGKVQQVRHVEGYAVIDNLRAVFPDYSGPDAEDQRLVVYELGPEIPMRAPLPCGTNYRASRLWVPLDLLLTSSTLKEALALSRMRSGAVLP
jgi:hypothetical protein